MPGGSTQVVRVAQIDQSTALRRRRPQAQLLPRTPFSPLCLSSNRASFVNSYASVRVRPGAPFHGGHGAISSIVPCEGAGEGAIPFGHPNFDGPLIVGYPRPSGAYSLIARE